MNRQEFQRLKGYSIAKANAPYTTKIGRRHAKGRAKGVGQILKNSSIKHMSFDPLEIDFKPVTQFNPFINHK